MALTDEQKKWVNANYKGVGAKELTRQLNKKFGTSVAVSVVKSYKSNHALDSGLTGRFKKGNVPANKGTQGLFNVGGNKTSFKKGQVPPNTDPIGTEKLHADGFIWVKINNLPKVKKTVNWRPKHVYMWEQAYGPVPKNHIIIFLDGNRQNFDLNNLKMISKATNARLNKNHLRHKNKELTETGILIAELMTKASSAKRRKR